MLTRIGDLAQGQRLAATLLATQGRLREAEAAVASGKAASRYDQIADAAGLQAAMAGLGTALDELTGLRGKLSAKTARLESIAEGHRAGLVYLDEVVSGIEDADLPEVLTRLARDQASVEATYLVTGRLAALSLADYLR
jgi:flagellar hook-associated protein 3 FlgL